MTAEELLEQSMISDITEDLIDPEVVWRQDIPQISSWDHSLPDGQFPSTNSPRIIRAGDALSSTDVDVAAGGYAFGYIAPSAERGMSLEATNVNIKAHHHVRVMRLR